MTSVLGKVNQGFICPANVQTQLSFIIIELLYCSRWHQFVIIFSCVRYYTSHFRAKYRHNNTFKW